jgi:hypothetical protein
MTMRRWSVVPAMAAAALAVGVGTAAAQGAVTSEAIAKANNPLADMNAVNLQDYYTPAFNGSASARANTLNVRGVIVTGRQVIRATLPVVSTASASGLGDLNVFDAFLLTGSGARTQFGVGPLLVIPTNTSDALGAGSSWQLGGAAVLVHSLPGGSLVGGLLTWQTDVVGGDNRVDTNLGTAQLFATFPIGNGWYVRSSPLALFDFENDRYLVPFGLGVGKVFPVGGMLANVFVEPQVTAFYHGAGQPTIQIFSGLNLQFGR